MCACTHTHATPARRNRRRALVIFSTSLLLVGGGVAWAAWSTSGTGAATAKATTADSLVVGPGTPVGTLYPKPAGGYGSGTVGAVHTTVSNPNAYPVRITQATVGAITITPALGKTCAPGSVVASTAGPMTLTSPIALAANAAPAAVEIPGAIEMISSAEDGCQGASIGLTLTLTAASA
ncbi:hypothetical protein DQ239_16665 [Blastococcus sp. TF02-09]|uniref:hypothetical protein n=1 Tax=Blastococcus sp. TF02-09 TaxID=2250576 RepID=UPI000DE93E5E|nr:hypothetical protein [Blastococcus sp. TF02-9]RBY75723.1 hypothetical protein DQ239_16665 [Blastococcus sp. TF02-9]